MYDVFAGAKYVISAEMTTYEGKRYLRMVFQDGFMPQYEIGDEIVKSELYFPAHRHQTQHNQELMSTHCISSLSMLHISQQEPLHEY